MGHTSWGGTDMWEMSDCMLVAAVEHLGLSNKIMEKLDEERSKFLCKDRIGFTG
jgi:hypothetical protein